MKRRNRRIKSSSMPSKNIPVEDPIDDLKALWIEHATWSGDSVIFHTVTGQVVQVDF